MSQELQSIHDQVTEETVIYNMGWKAAIEAAAKVAEAHKGAAAKRRGLKGMKLSNFGPEAAAEIQAEERGEDIAAEIIARTIRQIAE